MMMSADIPPNQSIYIKNLNEKVKKEELKRSLYALFSQYGRILDIVALKTEKLRGQAWVVFSEVTAATNAVRQMQNFPFYDKPMRIQYAKTKSDCIAKAEEEYDKDKKKEGKAEKKRKAEEGQQNIHANGTKAANSAPFGSYAKPVGQEQQATNNKLFVQNLPKETTQEMLQVLFSKFPGYREVSLVEAKPGIAFVEYNDDVQSSAAMEAFQGFKIAPGNPMTISFAKK